MLFFQGGGAAELSQRETDTAAAGQSTAARYPAKEYAAATQHPAATKYTASPAYTAGTQDAAGTKDTHASARQELIPGGTLNISRWCEPPVVGKQSVAPAGAAEDHVTPSRRPLRGSSRSSF
jgi:hypothetical protein